MAGLGDTEVPNRPPVLGAFQEVGPELWVAHDRAIAIIDRMEYLLDSEHDDASNLLVVGEPNSGKTALIRHFLSQHAVTATVSGAPGFYICALAVRPSATSSTSWLNDELSRYLLFRQTERAWSADAPDEYGEALWQIGVRILIIDDLHFVAFHNSAAKSDLHIQLLRLCRAGEISVVGFCTEENAQHLRHDLRLLRFEVLKLPRWTMGSDYLRFLADLDRAIGGPSGCGLTEPAIASKLLTLSNGMTGRIVSLAREAAGEAFKPGRPPMSPELLTLVDLPDISHSTHLPHPSI